MISYQLKNFKYPIQVKDWSISALMNTKLNRLKKSNPQAFFYSVPNIQNIKFGELSFLLTITNNNLILQKPATILMEDLENNIIKAEKELKSFNEK